MKPNLPLLIGIGATVIVCGIVLLAIHHHWMREDYEQARQREREDSAAKRDTDAQSTQEIVHRTILGFAPTTAS
jgi:hypothetical protein